MTRRTVSSAFAPEIGQAVFGQPHQQFTVPDVWDAALCFLRAELDRVMWNREQREYNSPFGNGGNRFECHTFTVEAYRWSDEDQSFNFKWKDVEISWYKYLGRSMSANVELSPDLAAKMLAECLPAARELDPS